MSVDVGFGIVGLLLTGILGTNIWFIRKVTSLDYYVRHCHYCKRSEAETATGLDLHSTIEDMEG